MACIGNPRNPAVIKPAMRALKGIDALVRMHELLDGCGCFYHARQSRIEDARRRQLREARRRERERPTCQ